jgi:hypothetical protein
LLLFFRGFGNSKEKVMAFRECFGRLGELRSLIPDCTPILALTATAAHAENKRGNSYIIEFEN